MDRPTTRITRDSGFQHNMGYRVETSDGHAVVTLELAEHHLNRAGLLHGGALMSLFDAALGYASAAESREGEHGGLVTVSITTNFIKAAASGTVRVEARRVGGGRKLIFASGEAFDRNGDLLATCSGTFRRLSQRPTA
ncbi:MAG: PaaI family thioesterase [Hyphomicrobiales bacterium]